MAESTLRLDPSRPYGEVRGERAPDHPEINVSYYQDGLPFDGQYQLVPDDGRTEPTRALVLGDDGVQRPVIYHPLYTKAMRDKLAQRLAVRKKGAKAPAPEQPGNPQAEKDALIAEVNLDAWIKGHESYESWLIFAAMKERMHKVYFKLADVVTDLVDTGFVDESQVDPRLMKLLDHAAA